MSKKYERKKKLTSAIESLREDGKVGKTTRGIFLSISPMCGMDNEQLTGNFDQPLFTIELADLETGEVTKYWADGGIRGALKLAKIKDGQKIEIEHTGQKKIEDGTVQTYDIYELE